MSERKKRWSSRKIGRHEEKEDKAEMRLTFIPLTQTQYTTAKGLRVVYSPRLHTTSPDVSRYSRLRPEPCLTLDSGLAEVRTCLNSTWRPAFCISDAVALQELSTSMTRIGEKSIHRVNSHMLICCPEPLPPAGRPQCTSPTRLTSSDSPDWPRYDCAQLNQSYPGQGPAMRAEARGDIYPIDGINWDASRPQDCPCKCPIGGAC